MQKRTKGGNLPQQQATQAVLSHQGLPLTGMNDRLGWPDHSTGSLVEVVMFPTQSIAREIASARNRTPVQNAAAAQLPLDATAGTA